ncbi:dihydroorotase [Halosimplex pelagicum]|uniref:Dihydroorotase n=1 Tax=Halosimplex pelagicum TaxID=869886 RepID=A0A7D5PAE5_9EURY|nr:dihydroorotase [Halosimplex pelagicum]QLH81502.1 dihydroorotase [Halosimplex pelagicum]
MLFRNATLADGRRRDVRVSGETVAAVGEDLGVREDERTVDATGKRLLPGMIDAHVHFREPGDSHKEDWTTGSASAAAGGVTTVVDQPNTSPPTVDGAAFDEKAALAADSLVDFGLNGGVTADWDPDSLLDRDIFALGEVFLADSTGNMGIEEPLFLDALAEADARDVTVTVHAEDAGLFNVSAQERDDADAWSAYRTARAEAAAVGRACEVAAERDTTIHVAHTSTPRGIDIAADAGMTCEVTPHHMYLSRNDLRELGTHGRMNPPLRREKRRQRVYDRVVDGTVDMVATDHAPHTADEKDAEIWDAPSGVPGVETALPLLLADARTGDLTYERVRDLTAANPADVFDLPNKGRVAEGMDADLVLVDPGKTHPIRADRLHTKCDWTPFEGREAVFPELTLVRGSVVYERDAGDRPGGESETFGDAVGRNVRTAAGGRDERGSEGGRLSRGDETESIADLAAEVVEEPPDEER